MINTGSTYMQLAALVRMMKDGEAPIAKISLRRCKELASMLIDLFIHWC
jgi:hypothetical protein